MRSLLEIALASALILVSAVARDRDELPHVRVWLNNAAGVPASTLDAAQQECSRIFRNAGIEIEWAGKEPAQPNDLLVTITAAASKDATSRAVGYVAHSPAGELAFVVWSRVLYWVNFNSPAFEITGRVMAHEIVHLLLPENPHSDTGLMRACWSPHDLRGPEASSLFLTVKQEKLARSEAIRRSTEFAGRSPKAGPLLSRSGCLPGGIGCRQ